MHTFLLLIFLALALMTCVIIARPSPASVEGKPQASKADKIKALGGLSAFFLVLVLATNEDEPKKVDPAEPPIPAQASSASPAPQAAQSPAPLVAEVSPTPAIPHHFYSLADEGEYGYERALSEEDKRQGMATKAVIMVRYLGEHDGTHSVQLMDGGAKQIYSCKLPCEFIRSKMYVQGEAVGSQVVKNAPGSVIWAVMQDAISGELEPYKAKHTAHEPEAAQ